jgi:hypothetical protein
MGFEARPILSVYEIRPKPAAAVAWPPDGRGISDRVPRSRAPKSKNVALYFINMRKGYFVL